MARKRPSEAECESSTKKVRSFLDEIDAERKERNDTIKQVGLRVLSLESQVTTLEEDKKMLENDKATEIRKVVRLEKEKAEFEAKLGPPTKISLAAACKNIEVTEELTSQEMKADLCRLDQQTKDLRARLERSRASERELRGASLEKDYEFFEKVARIRDLEEDDTNCRIKIAEAPREKSNMELDYQIGMSKSSSAYKTLNAECDILERLCAERYDIIRDKNEEFQKMREKCRLIEHIVKGDEEHRKQESDGRRTYRVGP